jgi:hypothetical protein
MEKARSLQRRMGINLVHKKSIAPLTPRTRPKKPSTVC